MSACPPSSEPRESPPAVALLMESVACALKWAFPRRHSRCDGRKCTAKILNFPLAISAWRTQEGLQSFAAALPTTGSTLSNRCSPRDSRSADNGEGAASNSPPWAERVNPSGSPQRNASVAEARAARHSTGASAAASCAASSASRCTDSGWRSTRISAVGGPPVGRRSSAPISPLRRTESICLGLIPTPDASSISTMCRAFGGEMPRQFWEFRAATFTIPATRSKSASAAPYSTVAFCPTATLRALCTKSAAPSRPRDAGAAYRAPQNSEGRV